MKKTTAEEEKKYKDLRRRMAKISHVIREWEKSRLKWHPDYKE